MAKLELTQTELIKKEKEKVLRYPNLNTVLMVEDFLEKYRDVPLKISEIRKRLPKQVMHQTLKIILEYLWKSGKIIYGPKGVQWIYTKPKHLKNMMEDTLEV